MRPPGAQPRRAAHTGASYSLRDIPATFHIRNPDTCCRRRPPSWRCCEETEAALVVAVLAVVARDGVREDAPDRATFRAGESPEGTARLRRDADGQLRIVLHLLAVQASGRATNDAGASHDGKVVTYPNCREQLGASLMT